MQLKVVETRNALHPSEVVVVVKTAQGSESLVVDRSSVHENLLEIGFPLGIDDNKTLVELPRETYSGAWRIWVNASDLVGRAA